MDENLYDEFGNYIGPEIPDVDVDNFSDEEQEIKSMEEQNNQEEQGIAQKIINEKYAIVLHEDKNYYPSAEEVFPGVETLVMEEDTQPLTEPIVAPMVKRDFDILEKSIPETNFDYDFMAGLMTRPELIRNIALAGSLHHGKTTLLDIFIEQTHHTKCENPQEFRYTDCRQDEQKRGLSVKAKPISLILQDSRDKSYLFNLMDTPGHPNFCDEITASFRLCDGVLIVVDIVEGIQLHTEKIIISAIKENLDVVLCINKIDRVILELRLPPTDAYFKIKQIIDEFNRIVSENIQFKAEAEKNYFVSPDNGNVIFTSSLYGIIFSLESFSRKYYENNKNLEKIDFENSNKAKTFAKMLWGDVYFDKRSRKFSKKPTGDENSSRTFVDFILEPLYKIVGYTVSEEKDSLKGILNKLGIDLRLSEYKLDPKPLLKLVCGKFLGHFSAFVETMLKCVVDSRKGSIIKIKNNYLGDKNTEVYSNIIKASANGYLAVNVTKLYHKYDYLTFDAFARVLSGTIKKGEVVKVLGETFNLQEKEDLVVKEITNMWIYQSRYRVEINKVPACNWVLLEGIDISISKTATITQVKDNIPMEIFKPLEFFNEPYMKVSVEPLNPSELPKMLEGLRKINKSYPLSKTKIEESGEHIILGTGELYMDCILHDLRKLYSEIEIKVSDPVVSFCETVVETSSIKCYADTNNKKNRLTLIAEPLEKGLSTDIENGYINMKKPQQDITRFLTEKYKWDAFTSNSIWAFGPDKTGTNMLIDYTLPSETDKMQLHSIRDSIVQGFDWACREGPLCEEPMKNTKFKILEAKTASETIYKSSGQIIPATRRVCYSAFLMASPRIMEPILVAEIVCPVDCIQACYTVLSRRRGHVNAETPKPGTPFYVINANIPGLDSFGFETDLRTHTAGQAFVLTWFDHWGVMPGDPLDRSIQFKPLEPSPPPHLAREAMIKTRRRKGLLEDVTISKFFDDPMLLELVKNDAEFKQYFEGNGTTNGRSNL